VARTLRDHFRIAGVHQGRYHDRGHNRLLWIVGSSLFSLYVSEFAWLRKNLRIARSGRSSIDMALPVGLRGTAWRYT
jgi:hypothetical protein